MTISRRSFLRNAAAGAATMFAGPESARAAQGQFANPLKIPALLEGADGLGGKTFELALAHGESRFLPESRRRPSA